jgi:hypothetical protein
MTINAVKGNLAARKETHCNIGKGESGVGKVEKKTPREKLPSL